MLGVVFTKTLYLWFLIVLCGNGMRCNGYATHNWSKMINIYIAILSIKNIALVEFLIWEDLDKVVHAKVRFRQFLKGDGKS